MTDQQAKEAGLVLAADAFILGSVWNDGKAKWQVIGRSPSVNECGPIITFEAVYDDSPFSMGTSMNVVLARKRMTPMGIMPVGSI